MRKSNFLFFISLVIFLNIKCLGRGTDTLSESASADPAQEQLQLCFIYSNLLGFNIDHVDNPRLYEGVNEWLGTPYRYSGNTRKGVDCSGLVCELYKDCYGKVLTGCASDMYKNSEQISRSELREGDLVFFKIRKKRISHVGVYLGQNRFVHASLQNGVIVSNLDDPYYEKYFYRAGRIKP